MGTKVKSNSVITWTVTSDHKAIIFAVMGAGTETLYMDRLSPEVREWAPFHAMGQRIPDAAAIGKNGATGQPATPAEKHARIKRVVEHYNAGGSWALDRATAQRIEPRENVLTYLAIAAVHGCDEVAARARVERESERLKCTVGAYLAAVRTQPSLIKKEYGKLRDAEPTIAVDLGGLAIA